MTLHWLWLVGPLAPPGLLAVMILWISWRNWRIRHWQHTMGRIVESRATSRDVRSKESHLVRTSDQGTATVVTTEQIDRKNFADIAYEYTVAGKAFLSRQVGMGSDHGNLDVVALLQRYPKGKVVTVHYNPVSPGESILERDDPRRLRAAWFGVAVLAAVVVGGFFAFDTVVAFVEGLVRQPKRTPFVMFALVAALNMALMATAAAQRARAMRAWPTVEGVVVESRVERTTTRRIRGARTTTTPVYVPRVIYRFRVEGVEIAGDQVGRMARGAAFKRVERFVASYPVGTRLAVHYDPDEPTTAVVDPTAGLLPLALTAAAVAVVAYALAVL